MLQLAKDLVQQPRDTTQWAIVVQQASDGAKQVAQQVARAGLRSDVEDDLIQMHHQTQQVEIQRAKLQVQDLARTVDVGHWKRDRNVRYRSNDVAQRVSQRTR